MNNNNLFAGTGSGVWRRPLSEMITSVPAEEGPTELPTQFSIEQNYPNPFNPTTTIRYAIPEASFAIIKVYDMLGNEIVTLVNEEHPAGNFEVEFNAEGLSSGMYFYKLQTDNFSTSKKMILIK